MHVKKSHSRINSLQTVRALAFFGIFSQHCGVGSLGALGVSVFLILSGFLMYYSYFDREIGHTFKECVLFSYTKISKLYPMHICMGAALVFVAIEIVRTMEANYVRYIFEIVMNVFLLQAWIPNRTIYYSLNGVAWYLSVCTFIYAMFPCILARLKRLDTVKQAMAILISVYFLQIGTALLLMGCGSNSLLKWYIYICPI